MGVAVGLALISLLGLLGAITENFYASCAFAILDVLVLVGGLVLVYIAGYLATYYTISFAIVLVSCVLSILLMLDLDKIRRGPPPSPESEKQEKESVDPTLNETVC